MICSSFSLIIDRNLRQSLLQRKSFELSWANT